MAREKKIPEQVQAAMLKAAAEMAVRINSSSDIESCKTNFEGALAKIIQQYDAALS